EGCAEYHGESIAVEMTPQNDDQSVVRFNLKVEK
ncbi:guanylate cyclase, partial [Vibrio crassostreae]